MLTQVIKGLERSRRGKPLLDSNGVDDLFVVTSLLRLAPIYSTGDLSKGCKGHVGGSPFWTVRRVDDLRWPFYFRLKTLKK